MQSKAGRTSYKTASRPPAIIMTAPARGPLVTCAALPELEEFVAVVVGLIPVKIVTFETEVEVAPGLIPVASGSGVDIGRQE